MKTKAKAKDNIVYKIASFLKEEFDIHQGVTIKIEKNIPIAAGLAGGSADAAATLRGLNKLWKLNMTLDDMAKLGLEFGSDIPFCVYNKTALAKGRGEKLTFLNVKNKFHVLLVNPNVEVSTGKVFQALKEEDYTEKNIFLMEEALVSKDITEITREMFNILEVVTFKMIPKLRGIKNCLIDLGLDSTLMSGSGATIFSLEKDKKKLKALIPQIKEEYFTILTKLL